MPLKEKRSYSHHILLLGCLMVFFVLAAGFLRSFAGDEGKESLIVGVPVDRCPVFYEDSHTGAITGIGTDLIKLAAEKAGFSVIFTKISEKTLKEALDNEEYDVLLPFGSAVESASGQKSIVSDNLFQTPFTLVTEGRREMPPLNEIRVGMLESLAAGAETVRELYPGIEIILYKTMNESVKALRNGKVNALLHNSYVWSYILQKPSYSDLSVQPSTMFSMDFRVGALDTPEKRELIEKLNTGIAGLMDTQRQAVILDYTTRRLYRYDFWDYLYLYGVAVILGLLLLISLIVITFMRIHTIKLEQEEKVQQLIDLDPLTGAYSLIGFKKKVEELLRVYPDVPYLLIYNNIKNFKYINDSLGRAAGDELLRFYINKIQENLTEEETICRISADHFAIFSRADGDEELLRRDRELMDSIKTFFLDQGKEFRVQICGGIYVLTPEDYQVVDVDRMLDYARVAEKRIYDSRQDGYEFYNPEQWEKGKHIAEVINRLPSAIEAGDLQVWYQPQMDYATGQIIGAEALCRWDHAKLGWLQPSDFISTLEESDLIYDLDRFVWKRVCEDLHRWNEQGIKRCVSVNVSRCDIREGRDVPGHFLNLIKTYELTPDQLHVEITETAYVEKPPLLIETTQRLREYGFLVEMDDFGSGYSSLHMLKEVAVDRIKLDINFLTESGDPEKGRIIVGFMISMVQKLGMNMIAEGVETQEQAEFLKKQGCCEMQGYFFYKPMPVTEFESLPFKGSKA